MYTPVECVDFIIHSVNDLLQQEFHTSLTEKDVHILDPFTGTGTFVTRLLQSGFIKKEDLKRKYQNQIHCNEIVLLAYYIANVNIESVYHAIAGANEYLHYDNIILTDTFNITEDKESLSYEELQENNERILRQQKSPIRVIIGNPPYSVAKSTKHEALDESLEKTYVANTKASNKNSIYDSYIQAFRWASDRLAETKEGGVIAFISNGGWLDGNAMDGMRKCFRQEFSDIYVFNLRGNQRTSGELRRKEKDNVFGQGTRTPITITFLVKNPTKASSGKYNAKIYYRDIGDYLSQKEKLSIIKNFKSVSNEQMQWQ